MAALLGMCLQYAVSVWASRFFCIHSSTMPLYNALGWYPLDHYCRHGHL
jgi:hypothetical protein